MTDSPQDEFTEGVGRSTGARNKLVRDLMQDAIRTGQCPFCEPLFSSKNGGWVIELADVQHWNVWHSPSPFSGTKHHIMLAPHDHVTDAGQLAQVAFGELQYVLDELRKMFGYVSWSLLSRQGQMQFNSATVEHLHYHVIVSSGEPASTDMIDPAVLAMIDRLLADAGCWGDTKATKDLLEKIMEGADVMREAISEKAVPIRPKLSNKIGNNGPPLD